MSAVPVKVLVVDDEPPIRKLLRMGLSTQGYQILEAPNGKTALDLLAQDPGVIILDLGLPDMHGLDLLRMIRGRNDSVPIVVLSSRGDEAGKVSAKFRRVEKSSHQCLQRESVPQGSEVRSQALGIGFTLQESPIKRADDVRLNFIGKDWVQSHDLGGLRIRQRRAVPSGFGNSNRSRIGAAPRKPVEQIRPSLADRIERVELGSFEPLVAQARQQARILRHRQGLQQHVRTTLHVERIEV